MCSLGSKNFRILLLLSTSTLETQIKQWHGKIFSLLYTKKRMDGAGVRLGEGEGRVQGEPGGGGGTRVDGCCQGR